jgi:hypothetical protein
MDAPPASGRLRFSVSVAEPIEDLRLMVLDEGGTVQVRIHLHARGTRIPVQLTGFPRGRTYLVCAFSGDTMIWSSPVLSG